MTSTPTTWRAQIYKDPYHGVSKPWCADLVDPDGKRWNGYLYAYRSRKALEQALDAAISCSGIKCLKMRWRDR